MTPETKAIVIARAKSFGWRLGCAMVVAGLSYVGQVITGLTLPPEVIGVLGLGLGEISKYVNDHTDMFGSARKA